MKVKWKELLFWTTVAVMPGGIIIAACRLGLGHRKLAKIVKGLVTK